MRRASRNDCQYGPSCRAARLSALPPASAAQRQEKKFSRIYVKKHFPSTFALWFASGACGMLPLKAGRKETRVTVSERGFCGRVEAGLVGRRWMRWAVVHALKGRCGLPAFAVRCRVLPEGGCAGGGCPDESNTSQINLVCSDPEDTESKMVCKKRGVLSFDLLLSGRNLKQPYSSNTVQSFRFV